MGCSASLEVDPGFQGKNFNVCAQGDLPWDLQPWFWRTAEDHPHHWLSCSSGELSVQLRVLGGVFSLSKAATRHLDANHLSGTHSRNYPGVMAVSLCAQRAALASHPQALTMLGHQTPLQGLAEEITQKQPQPGNISIPECYYLHKYLLLI